MSNTGFLPPKAYPLNIPAGGSIPIDAPGVFCRIQTASGSLKIGFDLGTPFLTTAGKAYQCLPGQTFSRIQIENPDNVNLLTVTILIGFMVEYDNTLQIVGNTAGLALDGTDATGVVSPAGAAGIRGWLSSIYEQLTSSKNTPWTPVQGTKLVAAAGTPQALAAVDTFVDALDIQALVTNTGTIKVGYLAGAGNQLWILQPSEWRGVKAPNGKRINLKNVYVDAAVNGEGVTYESHV